MRLKVLGSTAVPQDVSNPMAHLVFDNSVHGVRFDLTAETGGHEHSVGGACMRAACTHAGIRST